MWVEARAWTTSRRVLDLQRVDPGEGEANVADERSLAQSADNHGHLGSQLDSQQLPPAAAGLKALSLTLLGRAAAGLLLRARFIRGGSLRGHFLRPQRPKRRPATEGLYALLGFRPALASQPRGR